MNFYTFLCAFAFAIVVKNVSPLSAQEREPPAGLPYLRDEVIHESDSFIFEWLILCIFATESAFTSCVCVCVS